MPMFCAVTGMEKRKAFTIEFLGVAYDQDQVTSRQQLEATELQVADGLEYRTTLTRGLMAKIPPGYAGFYEVTFTPDIDEEVFWAKFAFICCHSPLLLYRCFRHAIVGSSVACELTVAGSSRQP